MTSKVKVKPKDFRWEYLPYGIWTCADGRQVLFNRRYKPIWQLLPTGHVIRADPIERVEFIEERWFYTDSTPERDKQLRGWKELAAWNIPPELVGPPRSRILTGAEFIAGHKPPVIH